MAVTENFFTGDGSTTSYVLTFEYIDEDDVKVSLDGSITTAYSFANATTILFNTAPASDVAIRIYRDTDIDELKSTFFAGSSIRAQDLNKNFEQNNFAVQEIKNYTWDNETDTIHSDETWVSSDTQIATTAAMDARFQDEAAETIESGETWVSDNDHIATTAAIDARFQDELSETITSAEAWANNDDTIATTAAIDDQIDQAITNDIGTDGTGITITDDGDGTITLGLGSGSIDLDRIKADDIITYAEQPTVTTSDNNIFTARAAERQFDTIVQTSTPSGSDWEVGKTWLQNDEDKTVRIWNGSQWVAVASGGAFTELAKVVYVDATNGDDSLAGHRISNPKRTIKAAMDQINAETDAVGNGSLIIVAPGIYGEEFPITIEKNDVSIVGTSLRNCIIHPAIGVTAATAAVNGSEYRIRFVGTTDFTAIGAPDNDIGTVFTATGAGTGTGTLEDTAVQAAYDVDVPEANELQTMFQVNSGTYIQNLTLQGMKGDGTRGGNILDTDATFGLPTDQGWNFAFFPGATIRKSPYIQNCTNFSDSQINNVNFTPHVPGEGAAGDLDSDGFAGGGILIDGDTVDDNSPLRSMVCDSYTHTALNGPGIFVTNNGYTQVTSSYAFFTHYHLKCLNGGQANLAASTSDFGRYSLIADGRSTTNIFTADLTVNAADLATTFTIGQPTADASWHGNATRPQPNMLVVLNGITYPILSSTPNGLGWDVEISRPDPANRSNNLGLDGAVNTPATAQFFLRSQIASSGHTMEYVGSGTDYRALPENATGTFPVGADDPVTADATAGTAPNGVPVEDRQTIVLNNGAIWTAITDHNGKFRIGGDQNTDATYEVDQQRGRVTFRTGSLSIPSLIENLDTNGFNIFDSTGHVNINDELDVNSNKIVNVSDPTNAQDAATKNYVDSQVSVADKIQEGNSSVEVVDTGSNGTITFTTEGSPRATIDSSGRVGVGTSIPTAKFQIGSYSATVPSLTSNSGAVISTTDVGNTQINIGTDPGSPYGGWIQMRDTIANVARPILLNPLGGSVGIGTTSPGSALEVNATAPVVTISSALANASSLEFKQAGTLYGRVRFDGNDFDIGNLYINGATIINAGNAERARIDSSGRLLVGTSTSTSVAGFGETKIQLKGNYESSITVVNNENNANTSGLILAKVRDTSIVQSGDPLGGIYYEGYDGSAHKIGATILAYVDGTPGTNDMPGRLTFSTTADGASSPTERLRIASTGAWGLSGANYGTSGQVLTSQGNAAAPQWASVVTTTNVANLSNPAVSDVTVTGIPASATNTVIALTNVSTTSTGTPQLNLQMGNGSMSTTDYYWTTGYNTAWQSGGAVSSIRLTSTDINSGANTFSGIIHISESNGRMAVTAQLGVKDSSLTMLLTGATWAGGGTIDRIRLWSGSGNFDNGRMSVHSW